MARLSDQLKEWLDRVEILAHGAERRRLEARQALGEDRPSEARSLALEMLADLPRSQTALAIWADAAEALLLDDEAVEAATRLSAEVPFRADVWLRRARAEARAGLEPWGSFERAAQIGDPVVDADAARIALADRDLGRSDPARADRWLDQVSFGARSSREVLRRRVEVRLDLGEVVAARRVAEALEEPEPLDAAGWLVHGRLLALDADPAAVLALQRALTLSAPSADRVVSAYVAELDDAVVLGEFREVVAAVGGLDDPVWRAAFATAEGRSADALEALADGARQGGGADVIARYLDAAVSLRSPEALRDALALAEASAPASLAPLRALAEALDGDDEARLVRLDAATGAAADWAAEERARIYSRWCPRDAPAEWPALVAHLAGLGRSLGDLEALREVESIVVDLERPVRVAIVGEFNAGKSSFINAMLGEAVAPMGVLPTTATVNHLVWAPDRFVRIESDAGDDRIVPHQELKATLAELDIAAIRQVMIYAPLESLRRVELIDTPGFNAPNERHGQTARTALASAHAAIWLLDATQPLKDSERSVLTEIRDLGVPLIVLLNKADRVAEPSDLDAALAHVRSGLDDAGLAVEADPVAFSARLALEERVRGGEGSPSSQWHEVERVIDSVVVGRSAELRDRALRRRALDVVQRLGAAMHDRVVTRQQAVTAAEARRAWASEALARLEGRRRELETEVARALGSSLDLLEEELRPVTVAEGDARARRFVASRSRTHLVGPLCRALTQGVGGDDSLERALEPVIGAMVAVAVFEVRGGQGADAAQQRLCALAVDELASTLAGLQAESPSSGDEPLAAARIQSLSRALSVDPRSGLNPSPASDV